MANNQSITDIASVHLGKAGDGTIVKPYETPTKVDASLLVGIPRELNRKEMNINVKMEGIDRWNCFEFSTLTNNGYPVNGKVILMYRSSTPNIVESKSLKLYLNSFNLHKLGNTIDEVVAVADKMIYDDLYNVLGCTEKNDLVVGIVTDRAADRMAEFDITDMKYFRLDTLVDQNKLLNYDFSKPFKKLKTTNTDHPRAYRLFTSGLRSNCRVTNQPDWGDMYLYYAGDKHIDEISLLHYIIAMRNQNHFHEEICEQIFNDIMPLCKDLVVCCLYTRRGGIDINPIRSSSSILAAREINLHKIGMTKTFRQ
jgi:7-cyano-7-deazaguanine reductase